MLKQLTTILATTLALLAHPASAVPCQGISKTWRCTLPKTKST